MVNGRRLCFRAQATSGKWRRVHVSLRGEHPPTVTHCGRIFLPADHWERFKLLIPQLSGGLYDVSEERSVKGTR